MRTLVCLLALFGIAAAQYEGGFVKILGNHREQEDGIKYHEETDANNIRRGYWEYPSSDGRVLRSEFEAGPGIGFRITKSNYLDITPVANQGPAVAPVHTPKSHAPAAPQVHAPIPAAPIPVVRSTTPQPGPINLFDYPANLDFSRHSQGHRFKFTAA